MKLFIKLIAFYFLTSLPANAATYAERSRLSDFIDELRLLADIVDDAERHADEGSRDIFDYQALRDDMNKVKEGVEDYLNKARREPRRLPPVEGEY